VAFFNSITKIALLKINIKFCWEGGESLLVFANKNNKPNHISRQAVAPEYYVAKRLYFSLIISFFAAANSVLCVPISLSSQRVAEICWFSLLSLLRTILYDMARVKSSAPAQINAAPRLLFFYSSIKFCGQHKSKHCGLFTLGWSKRLKPALLVSPHEANHLFYMCIHFVSLFSLKNRPFKA